MWKDEGRDDSDWGDGLDRCEACGEDIRANASLCRRCEEQEYIDNDESFDPRRFGFEAGYR